MLSNACLNKGLILFVFMFLDYNCRSILARAKCVHCPWVLQAERSGLYCHNPGQPKTKSPGVVLLLLVRETTPHHHTTPGIITIRAVLGNLGSWFLVCSLILTQLEEIWKMTSIFLKLEEDINFFEKGRRPQCFWKWKTTWKK